MATKEPRTRRFDASGKERFDKTQNFQVGDSGRDKSTVTFTIKRRKSNKTEAVNVRCGPKTKDSKVCGVVEGHYDSMQAAIKEERLKTDEELKRARARKNATKAARAKLEKAPF